MDCNLVHYDDVVQIAEIGVILMESASPMTAGDERSVLDWANHLSTAAEASRLAVRLHLLTLLFAVGVTAVQRGCIVKYLLTRFVYLSVFLLDTCIVLKHLYPLSSSKLCSSQAT